MRYAGFFIRASAWALDQFFLFWVSSLFLLLLAGSVSFFLRKVLLFSEGEQDSLMLLNHSGWISSLLWAGLTFLVRYFLGFFYEIVSLYYYGATLGKYLLGLKVVSDQGNPLTFQQSFLRPFAVFLSYCYFGLGFFLVFFHPKKKALHDLLVETVCILRQEG